MYAKLLNLKYGVNGLVYEGFLSLYNKSVNVTFENNAVPHGVILFRDKKKSSPCISVHLIKLDVLAQ